MVGKYCSARLGRSTAINERRWGTGAAGGKGTGSPVPHQICWTRPGWGGLWGSRLRMLQGMNVYAALDAEWSALAGTAPAGQHLHRWLQREPTLAGPTTPADLVAAVVVDRRWGRADPRLAALVRLAADDLAARAVLQCVLPGLRAEPLRYHRYHWRLAGPGDDLDDVTVELVGAAWEAIRARAGTTLADPENTVVRAAAEKLRTRRRAEARTRARSLPLARTGDGGPAGVHDARTTGVRDARTTGVHEARTTAERVMVALLDAIRAETVTARQADLVFNVRVARISGRDAGRRYGMTPGQVFHALSVAETALQRASA
jgi:hypothetical protein